MADGNIGNLWVELGIKETVTSGLKKILKDLRGADDETKRLRKSLKEAFENVNNAGSADALLFSLRKAAAEISKVENSAEALSRVLGRLDVPSMEKLSGKFNERDLTKYLDILQQIQRAIRETSGYPGDIGAGLSEKIRQMQGFLGDYKNLISQQSSWSKAKGFDEASEDMLKSFRSRFSTLRKEFGELWKSGEWNGEKGDRLNARMSALTTDLIQYIQNAKQVASTGNTVVQGANEATKALEKTEAQATKTAAAIERLGKASKSSGAKDMLGTQSGEFSNRMLNALRNADLEQLGIKNAIVQGKELWDVLNLINQKLNQLSKSEDNASVVKTWRSQIDNAMKYLDILQRLEIKEREISNLRTLNPNINSAELGKAQRIIDDFRTQLTGLEKSIFGTGVDNSFVISDYAKGLQMAFRDIKTITDSYKKENPLSVFSGGFAKVSSSISTVETKLSNLRTLMFEGWTKGLNTQMLVGPLREMENALVRLTTAQGNDKFLTNAEQMKNLLSDVAEATGRATAKMTEYRNAEKRARLTGELPSQEYTRQQAQQSRMKAEQDAELKALDAYAKRYMELAESKRASTEKRNAEVEQNVRKLAELWARARYEMDKVSRVGAKGDSLGVDTSRWKGARDAVAQFADTLSRVNPQSLGKVDMHNYEQTLLSLTRALGLATTAQREMNTERQKSDRKSASDANAAVNRYNKNLEATQSRYEKLYDTIVKLRSARAGAGVMGADTVQADETLNRLIQKARELQSILHRSNGSNIADGAARLSSKGYNVGEIASRREIELAQRETKALLAQQSRMKAEWKDATTSGFQASSRNLPGRSSIVAEYKELRDIYAKTAETLAAKHSEEEKKINQQLDAYLKQQRYIEEKMRALSPNMDGKAWNGKALSSSDMSKYETYAKELANLKSTQEAQMNGVLASFDKEGRKIQWVTEQVRLLDEAMAKASRATYKPYDSLGYDQQRTSNTAALKADMEERAKLSKERAKDEEKAAQEAVRLAQIINEIDRTSRKGQFLNIDQTNIQAARKELKDFLDLLKQMSGNGAWNRNGKHAREFISSAEYKNAISAAKEYTSEQKKLQGELEIVERRINSMRNALNKAQQVRLETHGLGIDTKTIDDLIDKTKSSIYYLEELRKSLREGKASMLGEMGSTGNGREVQVVNRETAAQASVNKEIKQGIELEEKRRKAVAETAAKVRTDLVSAFEKAKQSASGTSQTLQDLKSLFLQGGLVYGAQQFTMSIIQTGGELEKQHIALQSILGDMQNANTMFGQIKQLALASPFTFSELNKDVKQLAAYGVEYDDLYDTTKRLADMASGLGVSFERIALAFGQVQARGWLDGKELRQIAYAGIPLLDRLSEYYSKREGQKVSTSEVKTRISARGVSFDDVKNIFWEMTDAGGQFYNMQQVLSETLLGRFNKLKDAWEIMLSGFASGNNIVGKGLMATLDLVTNLVQALNSMAPVVVAAFSGVALGKLKSSIGGGIGSAILSGKASMSAELQQKVLAGKTLEASEQRILSTKMRITAQDLRNLTAAKALTKNDLDRMLITNQITTAQYKQAMAMLGLQIKTFSWRNALASVKNAWVSLKGSVMQIGAAIGSLRATTTTLWTGFKTRGLAAISLVAAGFKTLGATLWAAIGGLPGLIITAVTMGLGYLYTKNEELKTAMKNTADEIQDRIKSLYEFIRDSKIEKVISVGDTSEIDNLIEAYKEKLKQLAPYAYKGIVMTAEEKNSHKERLRYLDEEIQKLKKAEETAKEKLSDSGIYKGLQEKVQGMNTVFNNMNGLIARDIKGGMPSEQATVTDRKIYADILNMNASWIADFLKKQFGDVAGDETVRMAAVQAMNSIFSSLEIPEDRANEIRASVLQSFGVGDTDAWLQDEVGRRMSALINEEASAIGYKIRSGQKLNDAEKKKVKELMAEAEAGIKKQWPGLESSVKKLLADSNLELVIKLVLDDAGSYNDVQSEMEKRIPSIANDKYHQYARSWGAEGGWYAARNAAKNDIDKLYNEYKSARESNSPKLAEAKTNYQTAVDAAEKLLYYKYTGEDKKNNKDPKDKNKEDAFLKAWNERLSSYKSARQSYQKYKTVMSEGEAKTLIEGLFDNIRNLDLDNYEASLETLERELEKAGLTTPERKKALTSLKREVADWRFSEVLKPEMERIAENFREALESGASQAELYKNLLNQTGDKQFAMQAFSGGVMWDDYSRGLAEQFKEMTGFAPDTNASDTDAKHYLVDIMGNQQAYDLWKKLSDYVKNNYNEALKEAAAILKESATYEEQKLRLEQEYTEAVKAANSVGGEEGERMKRDAEKKYRKGVADVNLKQAESSESYIKFFSRSIEQSKQELEKYADILREKLSEALDSGAITAEEYSKKIEEINTRMDDLNDFQFLGGGLDGIAKAMKKRGERLKEEGTNEFEKYQDMYDQAVAAGDQEMMEKAQKGMDKSQKKIDKGNSLINAASMMSESMDTVGMVVHGINNIVQGLNEAFQDIKETATVLGKNTESDSWVDATSFFTGFSDASASATKAFDSLKSGDIGGVISGVIGSFTGWIKAFARGHDQKLDNQIKIAERQEKYLENISSNIDSVVSSTLGGIYNYKASDYTTKGLTKILNESGAIKEMMTWMHDSLGIDYSSMKANEYKADTITQAEKALASGTAYDAQLASLLAQRDMLQIKRDSEADKKDSDEDKLADYDSQIEEMRLKIQEFASDFLKSVYSIDFKSWASELTDAVVSAWSAGEDAVDAYREKVRDMVKDVTKNIVTQKIMEKAMEKPLEYLTGLLEEKGQLDETDMDKLASMLYAIGDEVTPQITGIFDALKNRGWDFSETGSSSTKNSIKGITEETADLLASYLNAVRLDVSVNRKNLQTIADCVDSLPQMGEIQRSQLAAMNQLVTLAEARNSKLDDMYSWMKRVSTGTEKIYVK